MYNALLDRLPDSYAGYLIRTDFRIGIQISQCLSDPDLSAQERFLTAVRLLYGSGCPDDQEVAAAGIQWFLNGGCDAQKTEDVGGETRAFDFDFDHFRIWSAFRRVYGVDISREKLHWFQFLAMMQDLKDSALQDVMSYRLTDTAGMDAKTRAAYEKMKRVYRIPDRVSAADQAELDEKLRQAKARP